MAKLEHLWRSRIAMEEEERLVPIIEAIHSKSARIALLYDSCSLNRCHSDLLLQTIAAKG